MNSNTEIVEGNKLVAEFMGYEKSFRLDDPNLIQYNINHMLHRDIGLKYHSSWDWLMPTIKKIIELKVLAKKDAEIVLHKDISGRLTPILNELQNIDIHNCWYCVVQFISWYNQGKKDEVK